MSKILGMAAAGMMLLAAGACAQRADEQNKAAGTIVANDVAAVRSGAGADGRLTLDEFRVVAGSMIAALDTDANGALSAAELAALPEGRRRGWTMYDGDGDGTLTAAELRTAMAPKFTMRDGNHDGAITADEIPDGTAAGGFLF